MKTFLIELGQRLTSRKFLLSLSALLVAVANQEWNVALGVVVAYLSVNGAEGIADKFAK